MLQNARPILLLLLTLALVVGHVMHAVGSPNMAIKIDTMAFVEKPTPVKCDGCAGYEVGVAAAACAAYCVSLSFLPVATNSLYFVPGNVVGFITGTNLTGHGAPPDPYPPRSAALT